MEFPTVDYSLFSQNHEQTFKPRLKPEGFCDINDYAGSLQEKLERNLENYSERRKSFPK